MESCESHAPFLPRVKSRCGFLGYGLWRTSKPSSDDDSHLILSSRALLNQLYRPPIGGLKSSAGIDGRTVSNFLPLVESGQKS